MKQILIVVSKTNRKIECNNFVIFFFRKFVKLNETNLDEFF